MKTLTKFHDRLKLTKESYSTRPKIPRYRMRRKSVEEFTRSELCPHFSASAALCDILTPYEWITPYRPYTTGLKPQWWSVLKLLRSTIAICCALLAQLTAHRVTVDRRMTQILAILQRYATTVQFAPSYTLLRVLKSVHRADARKTRPSRLLLATLTKWRCRNHVLIDNQHSVSPR